MAEVILSHITKRFGDTLALDDLSLTIADGEFVVLLGPTGAGKTTTLRLIAGLETPEQGSISIGGIDMTRAAPSVRDVAFVFQQYSLYPHLTVYDNLAFPLRSPTRRTPAGEIDRKVRDIARLLQIETKLSNKATQLSGGQMQRVAIGRALVRDPSIYLMDEPLSSLDAKLRSELRLELKRIQQELGSTILYVTHDQIEAMTMASRIGVVDQGRLVQIGSPREIYEDPINTYVASRLGQPAINLMEARLFANAPMPRATETIGARTEHLTVSPAKNGSGMARVKWVEHLGDQSHMHLDFAGQSIVVLADPDAALDPGATVDLALSNPLYFDRAGRRVSA